MSTAKVVKEGRAMLAPDVSTDKVFYNPVQEFNRDLSCLVLTVFFEKLKLRHEDAVKRRNAKASVNSGSVENHNDNKSEAGVPNGTKTDAGNAKPFSAKILDVMAATGLRTCRYALEVPYVTQVAANDFDPVACESIRRNAAHNNCDKIQVYQKDARELMLTFGFQRNYFHAVDLDPFGTAAPFFEGALQCVADGGLLMVTCTDTAILCGNYPEACYARYGATSVRNPAHHEISLRIVLNAIASRAMLHERYIEPLLSLREGHYVRLFIKVSRGALEAKETVRNSALIYNCNVCHDFTLQPLCEKPKGYANSHVLSSNICEICGTNLKIGGPIWSGRIHDVSFVTDLISELTSHPDRFGTEKLLAGKLAMVQEEMPDRPLYYVAKDMFKVVHCNPIPSKQLLSAILHAGYTFSLSHCERESLKTNAPKQVMWDIIRCWVQKHPVSAERMEDAKISRILSKTPSITANFAPRPDADFESRRKKVLRFPELSQKGPMAKPKGSGQQREHSPSYSTEAKRLKTDDV
ncbi:tRNA (guanine(26)-N(2))-dimethyltransferase-like [Paramacrobiotus metropolitanus]|uniref:tRNA (guanine(26)-N(2))-dimethyltransferase-like n=1 Tax=Paramacrobiotus metropolitanus TaxID=2943436 RepID=UPI0024460A07|nr:tRNA (guanine(26)-N(2))-dimethyltransferase-like [Paramacrobiotus metropolitanus]XP_055346003.1 tRNA (guanine(26)-N(2))-dimethyltransferase-like [Paramacrobiotus metropolitanus]XP_055346011.1 tRNA (guanine(26)-N(2))-dimethyltransferase-like [Paramacrobiotus metropolitanus]